MKKKVCVVTGTRAEYHLLYPLMKAIEEEETLSLLLVATGAHLSPQYGNTYIDIENDGFTITAKIPILQKNDGVDEINQAMSRALTGFSAFYLRNRPDIVILLGDRYELLSAAIAAMNFRIPIAHLHGGETTEGAVDECIRHTITKMSYLHFVSCEAYRKRVIQLGESPDRVFNVGAIGLENIRKQKRMSLSELSESLNFPLGHSFAVVTFHPVTLEENTVEEQMGQLLQALDAFPHLKLIFTKANADSGGLCINHMIDEYVGMHSERATAVFSLGMVRYLSALSYASAVIGNSSSGIIETPLFGVPTINIGDRQRGRIQAENIINCAPEKDMIIKAVKTALSDEFNNTAHKARSPYGDGDVSRKIIYHLLEYLEDGKIDLKKSFYNIEFSIEEEKQG